jgi:hypothetical protein
MEAFLLQDGAHRAEYNPVFVYWRDGERWTRSPCKTSICSCYIPTASEFNFDAPESGPYCRVSHDGRTLDERPFWGEYLATIERERAGIRRKWVWDV